jgi:ribose 5-phosphate isomerase B
VENKRILIGSDHAGFELKEKLKRKLIDWGYEILDEGTYSSDRADYPDYAHKVAEEVHNHTAPLGVLICGSGNGVNMAANKHEGVRAAIAWTPELATLARTHNDANVLSLPARFITEDMAEDILKSFLEANFEGGRHENRVMKIDLK